MEPKNYSTIRSILKKEQGEKLLHTFLKSMIPKFAREFEYPEFWLHGSDTINFNPPQKDAAVL